MLWFWQSLMIWSFFAKKSFGGMNPTPYVYENGMLCSYRPEFRFKKFLILISGLTKIHDSDSSSNWFWFQCDPKNLIPISASCDSESNKTGFDANSRLSFQFQNHSQPWIEYVNRIHIQYPLLVWILTPWFNSIVMPTQYPYDPRLCQGANSLV